MLEADEPAGRLPNTACRRRSGALPRNWWASTKSSQAFAGREDARKAFGGEVLKLVHVERERPGCLERYISQTLRRLRGTSEGAASRWGGWGGGLGEVDDQSLAPVRDAADVDSVVPEDAGQDGIGG